MAKRTAYVSGRTGETVYLTDEEFAALAARGRQTTLTPAKDADARDVEPVATKGKIAETTGTPAAPAKQ